MQHFKKRFTIFLAFMSILLKSPLQSLVDLMDHARRLRQDFPAERLELVPVRITHSRVVKGYRVARR